MRARLLSRCLATLMFIAGCDDPNEPSVPASEGGLDAAIADGAVHDAARPLDAALTDASIDAALDAARSLDAANEGGFPADASGLGCPVLVIASDAACMQPGLRCGRKYRCATNIAVGPVGIEDCECKADRWQCEDVCANWQATLRDQ